MSKRKCASCYGRQGCVTFPTHPSIHPSPEWSVYSNIVFGFLVTSSNSVFTIFKPDHGKTDVAVMKKHTKFWENAFRLDNCHMSLFFRRAGKAENRWLCQKANQKQWKRPSTWSFLGCECGCTDLVVSHKLYKQENFLTNVLEERYRILIQLVLT